MPSHLVTLAPVHAASTERAGELVAELDEWFDVSASSEGKPHDGFASVDVGGHSLNVEEAGKEVSARLDQIDPKWRDSLSLRQ